MSRRNQQAIIHKLRETNSEYSIFLDIHNQQYDGHQFNMLDGLTESKQEMDGDNNQMSQQFFKFWMPNYEKVQYILRKSVENQAQLLGQHSLVTLERHASELRATIRKFKQLEQQLKATQQSKQQFQELQLTHQQQQKQETQQIQDVQSRKSKYTSNRLTFQITKIILKNPELLTAIDNVEVQIKLSHNSQQKLSRILVNESPIKSTNIKGRIRQFNGTNIHQNYQYWEPSSQTSIITIESLNDQSHNSSDDLIDLISGITIRIHYYSAQNTQPTCLTIPLTQQTVKHVFPIQQLVNISNNSTSQLKSHLHQHSQSSNYNLQGLEDQLGIVIFRIQYLPPNYREAIKLIIQICAIRLKTVNKQISTRNSRQSKSSEYQDQTIIIEKQPQSFLTEELPASYR